MTLKAYFDSSGGSDTAWVTLAGAVADESLWPGIEAGWKKVLLDREPSACFLHTKDAIALRKEFDKAKGWDAKKVEVLLFDCLKYIQTLDKQRFRYFFCAVDTTAHQKLLAQGHQIKDIVELCNEWCPEIIIKWYVKPSPSIVSAGVRYFFDQGEPFRHPFEKRWERQRHGNLNYSFLWGLITSITAPDMRETPGLQLADLMAWATNRKLSGTSNTYLSLQDIILAIAPFSGIVWDEAKLGREAALGT